MIFQWFGVPFWQAFGSILGSRGSLTKTRPKQDQSKRNAEICEDESLIRLELWYNTDLAKLRRILQGFALKDDVCYAGFSEWVPHLIYLDMVPKKS